ncbi:hypothetical protein [Blastococcus atacamensis]|uniref:hypothetical protein n=1 Tax=Blastococcus atacamensis TaxID=2070508 RepID=UPI0012FFE6D2|nr:hypothetical protein [Blastococcus atacamensis]
MPALPLTVPSPAAVGAAGCPTQGPGQTMHRTGAGSSAAVLTTAAAPWPAADDAAPTEPVVGSPTTTATDPTTRPD